MPLKPRPLKNKYPAYTPCMGFCVLYQMFAMETNLRAQAKPMGMWLRHLHGDVCIVLLFVWSMVSR
ncbi:hypothetical protein QBC37DRAFT_420499 [Rhypophila decipiens]|uniref:Uncharacterized protein n=1 Tax=Rhypophila decipiens TaxID=261697 RepID=A0AAN6YA70_9PEZI|nr:hypothetical protein QBC37DRAFT_420499 [Rhypophila decipiens]